MESADIICSVLQREDVIHRSKAAQNPNKKAPLPVRFDSLGLCRMNFLLCQADCILKCRQGLLKKSPERS